MEEPFACHPSFAQGYYDRDNAFYLAWDAIARDPATLESWLQGGSTAWAPTRSTWRSGGAEHWASLKAVRSLRRGRLRDVRVSDYTKNELMIAASARLLAGVENCFVGVGLPNIVCNLAQRTAAPELQLVYESGVFGARPRRLRCRSATRRSRPARPRCASMFELFAFYLQAGLIDVAFLGGAQIDQFGNLNTTVIGDYGRPKVRLPGSGGACEIAIHARQILVVMRQAERSFVESLRFRTSPGHSGDAEHDRARGWSGSGPTNVVTDLATYGFDEETGEMTLRTRIRGVTLEEVRANMGWEPRVASDVRETPPPSDEELRLLREGSTRHRASPRSSLGP